MTTPQQTTDPAKLQTAGSLAISAPSFEAVLAQKYAPADADILRWWFFAAREKGWSLGHISRLTGISTTVLSRLFRGEYQADPATMLRALDRARETYSETAENPDFIETSLWNKFCAIADKTRALRNVSIIFGPMGIGKTECIYEYQRRNNHGRTQVVRFPAGASMAYFIAHVARSVGVAFRRGNQFDQREKILATLAAGQRLLIIDELHQAFLTTRSDTAVRCCEFLREISDVAGCGLVLVGTEVLKKEIFEGPHRDALRQLVDRGTVQVTLSPRATRRDIEKFLAAYGLTFPEQDQDPTAHQILADIIAHHGLRKLTLHLRDAATYAAKRQEPCTWEHFVAAHQAIAQLSK
jgi:DNA transposition AAA+ family ATPase